MHGRAGEDEIADAAHAQALTLLEHVALIEQAGREGYDGPICGHIHKGTEPTGACPICGAKPSIFKKY